jgi:sugar phosphate isomerase/epimerase
MDRRNFIAGALSTVSLCACHSSYSHAQATSARFTMDLCPGRIGVEVDQRRAIKLAAAYGFQSVEPYGSYLAKLGQAELDELLGQLKEQNLVWGAASLEMEFRGDEKLFESGLQALPGMAKGLQRAGVTRLGTWIAPSHPQLTFLQNFKLHASRLRSVSKILNEHSIRFGLEYVGPKKSWSSKRFPFVHTMSETKELLAEMDVPNAGIVLDSWHWYCAEESVEDLRTLRQDQIVAVDLNDAPAGLERDQQIDNRRELPAATGVIDLASFLDVLRKLDYDGPIRAEPFNQSLNAMDDEDAVRTTATAMKKAMSIPTQI